MAIFIVSFFLGLYYSVVILAFFHGEYEDKKIFLLDLIPFFGVIRLFINKWRKLN